MVDEPVAILLRIGTGSSRSRCRSFLAVPALPGLGLRCRALPRQRRQDEPHLAVPSESSGAIRRHAGTGRDVPCQRCRALPCPSETCHSSRACSTMRLRVVTGLAFPASPCHETPCHKSPRLALPAMAFRTNRCPAIPCRPCHAPRGQAMPRVASDAGRVMPLHSRRATPCQRCVATACVAVPRHASHTAPIVADPVAAKPCQPVLS